MKLRNAPELQDYLLVSVIIPTYNRPTYLKDALLSLLTQNFDRERYEVLVVDNGPATEARAPLEAAPKSTLPVVRYIRESIIGLHNGRHTGAREARGQVLAYVDDDVIVHPDWLKALVEPFADTQVGCVGGKVLPKWEDVNPPDWWSRIDHSYLSLLDLGDKQLSLSWPRTIHGCNMAVRRPVLYQVGGFNPDAIADSRLIWLRGDGETGLLKKIYSAGYKVVYEPKAWLYHRIPASRLTPEYFFWRAFIQGISDSYSRIRQFPSKRAMLLHAAHSFLESARCYLSSLKNRRGKVAVKCNAWYWYGRGQHQLRAALNVALYRHVLQQTYLRSSNETGGPWQAIE